MAKRKSTKEKPEPTAELPPVSPPKKRPWLLGLSIALLVLWLIVLAGLAFFGEARLGD